MDNLNPFIYVPLTAWFLAHVIKFLQAVFRGEVDISYFYRAGGMPSAHSAAVSSLAIITAVYEGIDSPLFGVTAVFAIVIIYDSFGVRRSTGEHSILLNQLVKTRKEESIESIREVLGHKPIEVVAGVILGIVTALLLSVSKWSGNVESLTAVPSTNEQIMYVVLFTFVTASAFGKMIYLSRRKFRKVASSKKIKKIVGWTILPVGMLGLLTVLMQNQAIQNGNWRIWPLILLVVLVASQLYLWVNHYRVLRGNVAVELVRVSEIKKAKRAKKHKKR